MSIWDELGIAPTHDRASLRRAYASRLRQVKPEVDPAGFQRLRHAYEEALRHCDDAASPEPASAPPPPQSADAGEAPAAPEAEPPAPPPAPPVFQSAVELVETLQAAPAERHKQLLYEALRADGREEIDFQAAFQRALARLLLQHFERLNGLVPVFAERFGWEEGDDALHGSSPVSELMGRSRSRQWRLQVEASGPSDALGVRGALSLLRGPINPTAFENFAARKTNLADMREVLRQLLDDCPQALRYETNAETVEWWRRRVELQAGNAAKPAAGAGQSSGPRFSFWWIIFFVMILGQVGRCANSTVPDHSSGSSRSSHSYQDELDQRPKSWQPDEASTHFKHLKGAWNALVTYQPGDVVMHEKRLWKARTPLVGQPPGPELSGWDSF